MPDLSRPPHASRAALLLAIVLAAFNLRLAIVGVGPLIEDVRGDLGMGRAVAGLLATIPVVAMAVFGLVGAIVVPKLGATRLVGWSLAVLGAATALRAVMPSALPVLLLTVPISVAIALVGAALPSVVKRHFDARGGGVTGLYAAAINLGAAVASFAAVPLARALGGWRAAFALAAVPVALALPAWLRARPGEARAERARHLDLRGPSPTVLVLAVIFGLQSMSFYAVIMWVAVVYQEAGWSAEEAGVATGAIMLLAIPASAIVPALSDGGDRRYWIAAMATVMAIGVLGLALVPTQLSWLWLTAFALGAGGMFPLALALPLDVSADHAGASHATGWTLGIGYAISAIGPVAVGALRDATGGFAVALLAVAALSALPGVLALGLLKPPRRAAAVPTAA